MIFLISGFYFLIKEKMIKDCLLPRRCRSGSSPIRFTSCVCTKFSKTFDTNVRTLTSSVSQRKSPWKLRLNYDKDRFQKLVYWCMCTHQHFSLKFCRNAVFIACFLRVTFANFFQHYLFRHLFYEKYTVAAFWNDNFWYCIVLKIRV